MRCGFLFFFFKQKTADEITYGDWSSDVCSSDLHLSCLFGKALPTSCIRTACYTTPIRPPRHSKLLRLYASRAACCTSGCTESNPREEVRFAGSVICSRKKLARCSLRTTRCRLRRRSYACSPSGTWALTHIIVFAIRGCNAIIFNGHCTRLAIGLRLYMPIVTITKRSRNGFVRPTSIRSRKWTGRLCRWQTETTTGAMSASERGADILLNLKAPTDAAQRARTQVLSSPRS